MLSDGREIHHYDLYRLTDAGVVGQVLSDDIADSSLIIFIEWAGIAQAQLPADRLIIKIEAVGDEERQFTFLSSGPRSITFVQGLKR